MSSNSLAPSPATSPQPGRIVLIVGPSGSGKDTLLRLARGQLSDEPTIVFAPRDVTRPDTSREERAVDPSAFAELEATGGYAMSWRAHGLAYGVRAEINADVAAGQTVVVNASRSIVTSVRARYANVSVVLIDAPAAVRASRLAARGREASADVSARLSRTPEAFTPSDADVIIDNSGDPDEAAAILVHAIRS